MVWFLKTKAVFLILRNFPSKDPQPINFNPDHEGSLRLPPNTNGWRAPKWWALEKVTPFKHLAKWNNISPT